MPAISVIVPTRRCPAFLCRAINSILVQTFPDFEIVVVDNHPPESRVGSAREHSAWLRDKRVHLVEAAAPNAPAPLRNIGLAAAKGHWVTYLDDDDEFHPTKLEKQLAEAEASQLPLGLCQLRFCLPFRRRVRGCKEREIAGDDLLLHFPGTPTIFHRRASQVVFDDRLVAGEDIHYFQRLVRHFQTSRVFSVPEPLVDVHVQADSHANLNADGGWSAAEATLRDFGSPYTPAAQRAFRLRARLAYCKLHEGRTVEMIQTSALLLRDRQLRDARLILNCFLFKLRWSRRWLIS